MSVKKFVEAESLEAVSNAITQARQQSIEAAGAAQAFAAGAGASAAAATSAMDQVLAVSDQAYGARKWDVAEGYGERPPFEVVRFIGPFDPGPLAQPLDEWLQVAGPGSLPTPEGLVGEWVDGQTQLMCNPVSGASAYYWFMGGRFVGSTLVPSFTYDRGGSFYVQAADEHLNLSSASAKREVIPPLALTITTSSPGHALTIDRLDTAGGLVTIDWGDGSTVTHVSGVNVDLSHTYASPGEYSMVIDGLTWCERLEITGNSSIVSGDIGYWTLPSRMRVLNLTSNSLGGDVSHWSLPEGIGSVRLARNVLDGDLSGWRLPSSLTRLQIEENSFTGDLSQWKLPRLMSHLYLHFNGFSGAPDVSNNVSLSRLRYSRNGLSQADVDRVIMAIYNRRSAFTGPTELWIGGTTNAAPSGLLQANCPSPVTGAEMAYHLGHDPCEEGFKQWSIDIL